MRPDRLSATCPDMSAADRTDTPSLFRGCPPPLSDDEHEPTHLLTPLGPGQFESLTPRQIELGRLLAELLIADFKAFPPASDNSPTGLDRLATATHDDSGTAF